MDDLESIMNKEESEEESNENSSEVKQPNDWGISLNDEKKNFCITNYSIYIPKLYMFKVQKK